jgi:ElaA protein
MNWSFKKFDELSPMELYSIMQLRNEVFVVEQNCVYQDADNKDIQSYHLMGWDNNKLLAYTRIIPPGIAFAEASIGRVATSPAIRKTGMGRELMSVSLEKINSLFGNSPIRIGAQLYLEKFYTSLGFLSTGKHYMEDGIPHVEMINPS